MCEMTLFRAPKISVGLFVKNGEEFISDAVESVLNQTEKSFELIISNNNSTDRTQLILEGYAARDDRIKLLLQKSDISAGENAISTLFEARGEYFVWMACDDKWSKNFLETLSSTIRPNDVCVCPAVKINGQLWKVPKSFPKGRFASFYLSSELSGKCFYIYGLFNREKLMKSDLNLLSLSAAADQVFLLSLLKFGSFKSTPDAFLDYKIHEKSLAKRQLQQRTALMRLISRFPLEFYIKSVCGTPWINRFVLLAITPIKFIQVQSGVFLAFVKARI